MIKTISNLTLLFILLLCTTMQAAESDNDDFSGALSTLNQHISSEVDLSETQLHALRDIFKTARADLELNTANIKAGASSIETYETNFGPLFTDDGTKNYNTAITTGDGLALERAIHEVYLAVFTGIDSDLISSDLDFVEGLSFGSADYFPGTVPMPEDPNIIYAMEINASVPLDWGRPNLYSEQAARRPTGTYLAPGTIAEVIVPDELVNKGYNILVGAHTYNLEERPKQKRLALVTRSYPITNTVTKVANPLGGNIYIEVPMLADEGIVSIQFKNTIRAPFFSARSFDKMTNAEWIDTERDHPGAWTDIESDKVMLSVPSKWVRSYDDPVALMADYDAMMDVVSDYMGKPRTRNKTIAFMQVDVLFRGNAFYPGYPMSNYASFDSDTPKEPMVRELILNSTLLHEMGHATYMTKFSGETEAAVHMLYMKVATKMFGYTRQQAFGTSLTHSKNENVTLSDALNSWVLRDSFVDNENMDNAEAGYRFAGHADYVEINELFGDDTLSEFNRQLNIEYQDTGIDPVPDRNNHPANDRILRLSRAAGADLRPLTHLWGATPEDATELKILIDSENLLPSVKIYDRMVEYKSTVPITQAQFDVFIDKMYVSLWYKDFWDSLREEFDPARGIAAIARIDELIATYFPEGRPETVEVVATVYVNTDFGGASWSFSEGSYEISSINSAVGNDISSIKIAEGYVVNACENSDGSGYCESYSASMLELGELDNKIAYLEIQKAEIETETETDGEETETDGEGEGEETGGGSNSFMMLLLGLLFFFRQLKFSIQN